MALLPKRALYWPGYIVYSLVQLRIYLRKKHVMRNNGVYIQVRQNLNNEEC